MTAKYSQYWDVEGADGPSRVGPNMMAVVPTSNDVRLNYGRAPADLLGGLVTLLGLAGLAWVWASDRRRWAAEQQAEVWGERDQPWAGDLSELGARPPFVVNDRTEPSTAGQAETGDLDPDFSDPDLSDPDVADPDVAADADGASVEGNRETSDRPPSVFTDEPSAEAGPSADVGPDEPVEPDGP